MPSPYNWHWRTVTVPQIRAREQGCCLRCHTPFAKRYEVAHLVVPAGEPHHDDDDNLAYLCITCHKRHDYQEWARKCHETRCRRKDPERPLLAPLLPVAQLEEALRRSIAAQEAVDQIIADFHKREKPS